MYIYIHIYTYIYIYIYVYTCICCYYDVLNMFYICVNNLITILSNPTNRHFETIVFDMFVLIFDAGWKC